MKKIISLVITITVIFSAKAQDFTPDEPPLYPKNRNLLHRLVYLDLPGDYRPLKFTDYWIWAGAFGVIILLILTLLFAVRVKSLERLESLESDRDHRPSAASPGGENSLIIE